MYVLNDFCTSIFLEKHELSKNGKKYVFILSSKKKEQKLWLIKTWTWKRQTITNSLVGLFSFLSGNMPFFVSIFIVQKQKKTISFDTKVLFRISCNLSLNPIIIAFILREICIFRRQMKVHVTNGFGSDPKML